MSAYKTPSSLVSELKGFSYYFRIFHIVEDNDEKAEVNKILESYAKLPAATKKALVPVISDLSSIFFKG